MQKKDWSKLSWRETWDYIDTAYLELGMNLKEFLVNIGLEENEYFKRRKNQEPAPVESLEKICDLLKSD